VASDVAALLPVTRRFMFLEEGDVAEVRRKSIKIADARGATAFARGPRKRSARRRRRARQYSSLSWLKEIHEQPRAIAQTLEERVAGARLLDAAFGPGAKDVFAE